VTSITNDSSTPPQVEKYDCARGHEWTEEKKVDEPNEDRPFDLSLPQCPDCGKQFSGETECPYCDVELDQPSEGGWDQ